MRRYDVPEVGDLDGCPDWLRDAMTGYLQVMIRQLRLYDPAAPAIADALVRSGLTRIVDLGSGAGGPWPRLAERLIADGLPVQVTLTDLSPNAAAATTLDAVPSVAYHPTPVSALDVPAELPGMRTMFTALHHFDRDQVRSMLRAAQRDRVPFAAFEATGRSLRGLITILAVPFLVLLLMPRVVPTRPLALLLTYFPPILPLAIGWDGLASTLRSHTEDELRELVDEIAEPHYSWTVDHVRVPGLPVRLLQLVGCPEPGLFDREGGSP